LTPLDNSCGNPWQVCLLSPAPGFAREVVPRRRAVAAGKGGWWAVMGAHSFLPGLKLPKMLCLPPPRPSGTGGTCCGCCLLRHLLCPHLGSTSVCKLVLTWLHSSDGEGNWGCTHSTLQPDSDRVSWWQRAVAVHGAAPPPSSTLTVRSTYVDMEHICQHGAHTLAWSKYVGVEHICQHGARATAWSSYISTEQICWHGVCMSAWSTYVGIEHVCQCGARTSPWSTYVGMEHICQHGACTSLWSTYIGVAGPARVPAPCLAQGPWGSWAAEL